MGCLTATSAVAVPATRRFPCLPPIPLACHRLPLPLLDSLFGPNLSLPCSSWLVCHNMHYRCLLLPGPKSQLILIDYSLSMRAIVSVSPSLSPPSSPGKGRQSSRVSLCQLKRATTHCLTQFEPSSKYPVSGRKN